MDGFNNIIIQMVVRTIREFYKKMFDEFRQNPSKSSDKNFEKSKSTIKPRTISLADLSVHVE